MVLLTLVLACRRSPVEGGGEPYVAPMGGEQRSGSASAPVTDPPLLYWNPPQAAFQAAPPFVIPHPIACDEPIYAPQDGYIVTDPVPADPSADSWGASWEPFHEHPQWTGDPQTSVTFVWQTDADTLSSVVEIGMDGRGMPVTVEGSSFLLGDDDKDGRVHEVRVCGLLPDTTFRWRVGGDGHWGMERLHTTAPERGGDARIRFAVAGDSRDGMPVWRAALAGMSARGAAFRVITGDAVAVGEDIDQWNDWFDAGDGFLDQAPTISVNGNHESLARPYVGLFASPGNERNFSLDYGNVHLVVLNDTPTYAAEMAEQAAWLQADLAATDLPWKLVFHHKPGWTASNHPPDRDVRENFVPVEENGGVAIDFSGHNHNYERSVPLRDGVEVPPGEGTTYVVTAGAGAGLYANYGDEPQMIVGIVTWHYVIVDVQGRTLRLYAYDLAGNLLDQTEFTR